MQATYADVLCPEWAFRTGCDSLKERGTLVRLGRNQGPIFEIVSVEGPTAWIREPVTYRSEALVPLERLSVVGAH